MLYNIMFLKEVKEIYNVIPRGFKRKVVFQLIYNEMLKSGIIIKDNSKDIEKVIDDYVLKEKLDYKTFTLDMLNRSLCDFDLIEKTIKEVGIKKKNVDKQLYKLCKRESKNRENAKHVKREKITVDDDIESIEMLLFHKITKKTDIKNGYIFIDFNIDKLDVTIFNNNRVYSIKLSSNIYISTEKTDFYDKYNDIYYKFDSINNDIDKELSIDIKQFSQFINYLGYYIDYICKFTKYIDVDKIEKIFVNIPYYMEKNELDSILKENIDKRVEFINFFKTSFINYYINIFGNDFKFLKVYYDMYEIYKVENGKLSQCIEYRYNTIEHKYKKSDEILLIEFISKNSEETRQNIIEKFNT